MAIDNYNNKYAPEKHYTELLIRDGKVMQASELNEMQSIQNARVTKLANAMFKNGDVVSGAQIVVNAETGLVAATAGEIFLEGQVWDIPSSEFTIPVTGTVSVGVHLVESIISEEEDPDLAEKPGALRRKVVASWGWDNDNLPGNFYSIYTVENGIQKRKESTALTDSFNQALAVYDKDSTGSGTYTVSGFSLVVGADLPDGSQVYHLSEGRARIGGYSIELTASRRLIYPAEPDIREVGVEVLNATSDAATVNGQRILVAHPPIKRILSLRITVEETFTLVHGAYIGCTDDVPVTGLVSIEEIRQDDTVYQENVDFVKNGDMIDWSLGGNEMAAGSTYTARVRYLKDYDAVKVDLDGFSVVGAVPGTQIIFSYEQMLPRYDRLVMNQDGLTTWIKGMANERSPIVPSIPNSSLLLATVYQDWRPNRQVAIDCPRVVSFETILAIENRLDYVMQEVARNRLEMDASTREVGAKVGMFVDPLLDDSMRDQGIKQSAAVFEGILTLPLSCVVHDLTSDISLPQSADSIPVIKVAQPLATGDMQVNPYMAFAIPEGSATINPSVDRWTETKTEWASSITQTFYSSSNRTVYNSTTSSSRGGSYSSTSSSTSVSYGTSTQNLGTTNQAIQYLREITINYTVKNFGPGEILEYVNFGGVNVEVTGNKTANSSGELTGSFKIPASIPAGVKQIEFRGKASVAYATFTGQGTLEVTTLRRVQNVYRHTTTTTTITTVRYVNPDPLAQTFTLEEECMLSGVDLWFKARGTTNTQVQLREVQNGYPTSIVLGEVMVPPANQNLTGHTRCLFAAPIPLEAGTEYAIVILCNDAKTSLALAEMGKFDATQQTWVSSQPYNVGVLLSSSNATTWTAHQSSDLTFRLLTADYTETERTIDLGSVELPAGTTDLILRGLAELPSSSCRVEYQLTMPDGTQVTMSPEQGLSLTNTISGSVNVKAKLYGSKTSSPVLWPGTQIVSGQMATTADYVTRSVVARNAIKAILVYDAYIPAGSSVTPQIQVDNGAWKNMTASNTVIGDEGWSEYTFNTDLSNNNLIKVRLTLTGTPAARPFVSSIRLMATA